MPKTTRTASRQDDADRTDALAERAPTPGPKAGPGQLLAAAARLARQPRAVAIALLSAAGAARVAIALSDHGLYWPDEIYQSLEPGHRMAFGFGFLPWEFQEGARSWLFPGALGLLMKAAAAAGVSTGLGLAGVAKVAMALLTTLGLWASLRLGRALAGWSGALFALLLGAALPLSVVLGQRALSEVASAPLLAWAAVWTIEERDRSALLAGAASALAVALRPQNALVLAGLALLLVLGGRRRSAALFAGAAAVVALVAGGLLDWISWGAPFHSLLVNLRFNLVEGGNARYGVDPWSFYLTALGSAVGPALVVVIAGLVVIARRAPVLLATVIVYLTAHSLIAHKELRFLMPVVPIAMGLAGAGLAVLTERLARRRGGEPVGTARRGAASPLRPVRLAPALLLGGTAFAVMAFHASRMTFVDAGEWQAPWSEGPVWGAFDGVNRLLSQAGAQPDLCGLALLNIAPIDTGGYSYLHRDVPLIGIAVETSTDPRRLPAAAAFANYAIAPRSLGTIEGFTRAAENGEAVLFRRDGVCDPPPPDFSQLFPRD